MHISPIVTPQAGAERAASKVDLHSCRRSSRPGRATPLSRAMRDPYKAPWERQANARAMSTFCNEKQLPMMSQACGDWRSSAMASCARWLNSVGRCRCHNTVEYTSMPCSFMPIKFIY